MKYLALQLPGGYSFTTSAVPTGGASPLTNIINVGLDLAVITAIFVCLFMLILAGFSWMTSQGDKQKLASARQRIAMAIIGLIVVFTSFILINIIYTFFNLGGNNFLGSH
jgi:hypothetical protein